MWEAQTTMHSKTKRTTVRGSWKACLQWFSEVHLMEPWRVTKRTYFWDQYFTLNTQGMTRLASTAALLCWAVVYGTSRTCVRVAPNLTKSLYVGLVYIFMFANTKKCSILMDGTKHILPSRGRTRKVEQLMLWELCNMRADCWFETYWGQSSPDSGKIIGLFQPHCIYGGPSEIRVYSKQGELEVCYVDQVLVWLDYFLYHSSQK